jgi:hypothetical protein
MGCVGTIAALRRVRVWLGHALLVAFVLKALIPAGFMPDFSGRDGQSFKIVICTASGPKLVDANGSGDDHPEPLTKHAGEPCAVGALASLIAPELAAAAVVPAGVDAVASIPLMAFAVPPARAGPAHGPRAPPYLA